MEMLIVMTITAGVTGFMFANVWTQPSEVFSFIQKFIYLKLINSKYDIIHRLGLLLNKLTGCAKCCAVWVFVVLYFTKIEITIFMFGISIASYIGYKLNKTEK